MWFMTMLGINGPTVRIKHDFKPHQHIKIQLLFFRSPPGSVTTHTESKDIQSPCAVWFEDAIAYYGVKTALFDLHVLVPDSDVAAEVRIRRDGVLVISEANLQNAGIEEKMRYLQIPDSESERPDSDPDDDPAERAAAVLLSAADWDFDLADMISDPALCPLSSDRWPFIPPLPSLRDCFIKRWQDAPTGNHVFPGQTP